MAKAANSLFGIPLIFAEAADDPSNKIVVLLALERAAGFEYDDVAVRHALTYSIVYVPCRRIRDMHVFVVKDDFAYVMRGGSRAYFHLA